MASNPIKFPSQVDTLDEEAFDAMAIQICPSCSIEICQFCGRKYVMRKDELQSCLSPSCYVKGVLSALSSSQIEIDNKGEE